LIGLRGVAATADGLIAKRIVFVMRYVETAG